MQCFHGYNGKLGFDTVQPAIWEFTFDLLLRQITKILVLKKLICVALTIVHCDFVFREISDWLLLLVVNTNRLDELKEF